MLRRSGYMCVTIFVCRLFDMESTSIYYSQYIGFKKMQKPGPGANDIDIYF